MRHSVLFLAGLIAVSFSCQTPLSPESEIFESLPNLNGLAGKSDYLASPFVAAGDRVYLIGHQDGTFPDLGWHVGGEMGGICLHPRNSWMDSQPRLNLKEAHFASTTPDHLPIIHLQMSTGLTIRNQELRLKDCNLSLTERKE